MDHATGVLARSIAGSLWSLLKWGELAKCWVFEIGVCLQSCCSCSLASFLGKGLPVPACIVSICGSRPVYVTGLARGRAPVILFWWSVSPNDFVASSCCILMRWCQRSKNCSPFLCAKDISPADKSCVQQLFVVHIIECPPSCTTGIFIAAMGSVAPYLYTMYKWCSILN